MAFIGTVVTVLATTGLTVSRQSGRQHNDAYQELTNLKLQLAAAETNQRGYLLTGDNHYLEPYTQAIANVPAALNTAEQRAKDMTYQPDIIQLQSLVKERIEELDRAFELFRSGQGEAALAAVKSGQGPILQDQINTRITAIQQNQKNQLGRERNRTEVMNNLARGVSIITLAFTLALALLINYLYLKAIQAERQLDRAKDEFVSLASHQLRTPATGIKSILSTLLSGDMGALNKQQIYFMTKALESNERELHIIEELLNVARADAGRLVLRPSEMELNSLVNAIVAEQQPAIEAKKLKLQVKPASRPVVLRSDEEKLFMAIGNLLDNARKYTPEGGNITVTVRHKRDSAQIEVADNGTGIAESELTNIFDRFQRSRDVIHGNIEGTGLGLYLARKVAELHNGSIEVFSKQGHGSRFVMTLPIRRV